jgi:hypothetical protein
MGVDDAAMEYDEDKVCDPECSTRMLLRPDLYAFGLLCG